MHVLLIIAALAFAALTPFMHAPPPGNSEWSETSLDEAGETADKDDIRES